MSDDEENDDFFHLYLKQRIEEMRDELKYDPQEVQEVLSGLIIRFLSSRSDYVVIGGRAFMKYVDLSKFDKSDVNLLRSVDWDLGVIKTDLELFTKELVFFIEKNLPQHLSKLQFQDLYLSNFQILQIGYVIGNTITYFIDLHSVDSFNDRVRLNSVYYANLKWLFEELLTTMETTSEIKALKRYKRSEAIKSMIESLDGFDKNVLERLYHECEDGSPHETITGFSLPCEKLLAEYWKNVEK